MGELDYVDFPVFSQAEPMRIPVKGGPLWEVPVAPGAFYNLPEGFTIDQTRANEIESPLRWDLNTGRPFRWYDAPLGPVICAQIMMGVGAGFLITFLVGLLLN